MEWNKGRKGKGEVCKWIVVWMEDGMDGRDTFGVGDTAPPYGHPSSDLVNAAAVQLHLVWDARSVTGPTAGHAASFHTTSRG